MDWIPRWDSKEEVKKALKLYEEKVGGLDAGLRITTEELIIWGLEKDLISVYDGTCSTYKIYFRAPNGELIELYQQ